MPLLIGAHLTFICRYPGFHIGLCPHFTLGYEEVSCLKALVISLNFDAVALRTCMVYIICAWGSPLGRYSCTAQGASPGLFVTVHLLNPVGAALLYEYLERRGGYIEYLFDIAPSELSNQ